MRVSRTVARGIAGAVLISTGVSCAVDEVPAARRPLGDGLTTTTAAPTTTTAAPTTTTTTAPIDPVRAEVEAAYRNAVRVAEEAAMIPDRDSPALAQWNTGPMLDGWREDVGALLIQGRRISFPESSSRAIEIVAFQLSSPTEAIVEVCSRDDAIVTEVATGRVVNDAVTVSRKRAVLRDEGGWKLREREDIDGGGTGGCFES